MEESKYYVPEIEEFHVGFEMETSSWLNSEGYKSGWGKYKIEDLNLFINAYTYDLIPTEFRVKYLDREDIESLGWKIFSSYRKSIYVDFISAPDEDGDHFNLHYVFSSNLLVITITSYDAGVNNSCYFRGTIKNKSELRRLMKQLGINS